MRRVAALYLLALAGVASAAEREIRYAITLNGATVGESRATISGMETKGTTTLKLGAESKFEFAGTRSESGYKGFAAKLSQGTRTLAATLTDGKLFVGADAKSPIPPASYADGFYGSFALWTNWGLDAKLDAAAAQGKTKLDVFVFDGFGAGPVGIGRSRTVKTAKGPVRVRSLKFGALSVDLAFDADREPIGLDVPAQKFRILAEGYDGAFNDPFAAFPELSPAAFKTAQTSEWTPMRDGVKLRSEVVRPVTEAKVPTILVRTPYGREISAVANTWFAARGYAVVVQDVRGRGASEGEWDPMVNERRDGDDAISWIAKQPWSDGKVGMIGASYGGFVQWAAAASLNPALKCIVPQVSPPMSAMRNLPYLNGVPMLLSNLWWLRIVEGKDANLASATVGLPNPDGLLALPLTKTDDAVFGRDLPTWSRWLARDRASAWSGWNFQRDLAKVTIPSLSISGWFDGDEIGTMLNWETRARAGRKDQWVVYGPWTHIFNTSSKIGKTDFGDGALLELDPLYLRFFDTYLKGKSVGWGATPKAKAFVTGRNAWVESSSWPVQGSVSRRLSLAPGGGLAERATQGESKLVFDPAKSRVPPPLKKKTLDLDGELRVTKEQLKGTLLFRSAPMTRSETITGPMELDLAFSTNARSTDFFATVLDEAPDGTLTVVAQPGANRASYRDGDEPGLLTPGKRYRLPIRIWDFAHEFKPGHRMALMLSSDGFPTYARNLGYGDPLSTAKRMMAQRNRIFLGGKDGSVLRYRSVPSASKVSRTNRD